MEVVLNHRICLGGVENLTLSFGVRFVFYIKILSNVSELLATFCSRKKTAIKTFQITVNLINVLEVTTIFNN